MVTTKGNVTIKPCILVSLHSSVTGGVTYTRKTLDTPELPETVAAVEKTVDRDVERWETTKIVEDKIEHERAEDARKKARGEITKLCIKSAFGLICPVAYESELSEAIDRAHTIATSFNDDPTTRYTRVSLFVMRGHVASTDEEAAKAIGDEVRRLVSQMDAGINKLDVKAIREAADKARSLAAYAFRRTIRDRLGSGQIGTCGGSRDHEANREGRRDRGRRARRYPTRRDREGTHGVFGPGRRERARRARFRAGPVANVQRVAGLDLDDDEQGSKV